MKFRVVRLKIADNCYETLLTNLNPCEFPACVLKNVYRLRWGIETSFRELKYAVGLLNSNYLTDIELALDLFQ